MGLGRRQYKNNPVIDSSSTVISIPLTATIRGLMTEIDTALTAASITRRDISAVYISASRGADVLLNVGTIGAALTGFGVKITAGTNLYLPMTPDAEQLSYESTAIVDVMVLFG